MLTLIGERYTNAEIAAELVISKRTVESHVAALLRKLAAADRAALRKLASESIVGPPPRQAAPPHASHRSARRIAIIGEVHSTTAKMLAQSRKSLNASARLLERSNQLVGHSRTLRGQPTRGRPTDPAISP